MWKQWSCGSAVIACTCLGLMLGVGSFANARNHFQAQKGVGVTTHATGTFDVKVVPLTFEDATADSNLGSMSLDKQFHGDLEATSKGQMLTAGTAVKDSAAYVAIERVTGTMNGRSGTFILQHSGTMNRGALKLIVSVVPDSGTGQLAGLSGTMTISVANGKHSYDFEYAIADFH
jgi:Protein of unknown function (DUF3224)